MYSIKILGRNLLLNELIPKALDFFKMFLKSLKFKQFISLWISYIKQINPKSNKFVTRDRFQILLSNHYHDSITVMLIFCRQDYGKIIPGSTVIDIGANIGVFSLYAARCGAAKIYSFEPNKESYEVLLSNIKANNLEKIIFPFNLAVGSSDGEIISIPKKSSPYNKTISGIGDEKDYDPIESISLTSIISNNNISKIDFMKMDCEGAEYPIIYSMKKEAFNLITTLRLEHHLPDEKDKLIGFMNNIGFKKTRDTDLIMWFER